MRKELLVGVELEEWNWNLKRKELFVGVELELEEERIVCRVWNWTREKMVCPLSFVFVDLLFWGSSTFSRKTGGWVS